MLQDYQEAYREKIIQDIGRARGFASNLAGFSAIWLPAW